MQEITDEQSQLFDFSLLVPGTSFENFRLQSDLFTEQWQEKLGIKSFVAVSRQTATITVLSISVEYDFFNPGEQHS